MQITTSVPFDSVLCQCERQESDGVASFHSRPKSQYQYHYDNYNGDAYMFREDGAQWRRLQAKRGEAGVLTGGLMCLCRLFVDLSLCARRSEAQHGSHPTQPSLPTLSEGIVTA